MKLRYKYFVSYTHANGFGNSVLDYDKKINKKNVSDCLKEITRYLEHKNHFDKVAIINFQEVK